MSTSKTLHFDTKENMAERNVIRLTQEVVRGLLGLDDARVDRRFDRVYQVLATIYSKYETQLDQMESILAVNDLETSVQTFSGVMDNLFSDGHINPGRVAMVLVFASRMVQHCIKKEIILSNNVDQLAEAIGIQIAARLTKSPFMMEEFERFCLQSSVFERLPWKNIAYGVLSLGVVAVLFSIE